MPARKRPPKTPESGKLLTQLKISKGFQRGRGQFILKYGLAWSDDMFRNLEDGTTPMREDHLDELVRVGLVTKGSEQYTQFLTAIEGDRVGRVAPIPGKESEEIPDTKIDPLPEITHPSQALTEEEKKKLWKEDVKPSPSKVAADNKVVGIINGREVTDGEMRKAGELLVKTFREMERERKKGKK